MYRSASHWSIGLVILTGLLGCEPLPIPTEPSRSLLGVWLLDAEISAPVPTFGAEGVTPTSCHQSGPLAITEQRANGALSWTLEITTTCVPAYSRLEGSDFHKDNWDLTPWAHTRSDSIWITTPHSLFEIADTCTYTGVIRGEDPIRMSGNVVCDLAGSPFTGEPSPTFYGTWSASLP